MYQIYVHEGLTKMSVAKRSVLPQNPYISNKKYVSFLPEIYLQYFSNSLLSVSKNFHELTLALENKLQNL